MVHNHIKTSGVYFYGRSNQWKDGYDGALFSAILLFNGLHKAGVLIDEFRILYGILRTIHKLFGLIIYL